MNNADILAYCAFKDRDTRSVTFFVSPEVPSVSAKVYLREDGLQLFLACDLEETAL